MCNADLQDVILLGADLSEADLSYAHLHGTKFISANLSYAILDNSWMVGASLLNSDLTRARISSAKIHGISAWGIKKDGLIQERLTITSIDEPEIIIDDLEVAQFIYLLLNNQNFRKVIDTFTSRAILILGRFTEERKKVLDALKDELRKRNYLAIVFDFDKPSRRDIDETVNLLARMSRFVIADITDAHSIPQELRGIVPDNPSIPIVPLILKDQSKYAMFDHFRKYPWVLPLYEYETAEILLENIIPAIITPAEQKVAGLSGK